MSDRLARTVELASIALIGCCLAFFGWALLQNLTRFRLVSSLMLVVLAAFEVASIRRNVVQEGALFRIRSTRDAAFLIAALLAIGLVASPQRWLYGACISSAEFGILLELLARSGQA